MNTPAVILGAGLCGLSAGYHLNGKSDYLILERNHEAGGLARTESYDGFSFDHSIHILYSRDMYVTDLICNKLLGGNIRKQIRGSYCYSQGVYTEYPYQMNQYGLPPSVIVENILGLIEAREASQHRQAAPHFEAWIYQTYGRGIAENFLIPYNRRQWAWNLREMSYDWIADRVPVPELADVLRGALEPPKKKFGPNQEFWYPEEGGIEALPRAFLRHIPAERLWLNSTVASINGSRHEVSLTDGRSVRYGRMISTLPLPMLVGMLGDSAPAAIRKCAAELKCNTVHTVNIGLQGEGLSTTQPMHWIYFSENTTIFHRISFPSNFSRWMAPDGCCSIQAEISESNFRRVDRAGLVERTIADLRRVGIIRENAVIKTAKAITLDPAYIIYDLKHRENTETIKEYLRSLDIVSKGRFGEWEYLNMDHSILGGKAAAEAV
jgi:UDP-galactopyranose mutase